jgi:large subunit ribosomal protein L21
MYAIISTGGRQFRVTEGDRIVVDRLRAGVGETVRLDSVLMLGGDGQPAVGKPIVEGAYLTATIMNHRRGDKVIVFKFQERKRRKAKRGHRQELTELKIGAIHPPGKREE